MFLGNLSCINKGTKSPIRGIYFSDDQKANLVARRLREKGFATTLALYPTVYKGHGRIRLAISAIHTPAQIIRLASTLNQLRNAKESL